MPSEALKTPLTGWELAVQNFKYFERVPEAAGLSYEVRVIRDRLTLGLSTEPALKHSAVVDTDEDDQNTFPDVSMSRFVDNFD